jgi:hypothetical protein
VGILLVFLSLPLSFTAGALRHIWGNRDNQQVVSFLADNGLFNLESWYGKVERTTESIMGFDGLWIVDEEPGGSSDPAARPEVDAVIEAGLKITTDESGIMVDVQPYGNHDQRLDELLSPQVDLPRNYPVNRAAVRMAMIKTMWWNADWADRFSVHHLAFPWQYLYGLGFVEYRFLMPVVSNAVAGYILAWYVIPAGGAVLIVMGMIELRLKKKAAR